MSGLNGVDDAMQMPAWVGTELVNSAATNVNEGESTKYREQLEDSLDRYA